MDYSADKFCQKCGVVRPCGVHDQTKPESAGWTEVRPGVFVADRSDSIFAGRGAVIPKPPLIGQPEGPEAIVSLSDDRRALLSERLWAQADVEHQRGAPYTTSDLLKAAASALQCCPYCESKDHQIAFYREVIRAQEQTEKEKLR